MQPDKPMAATWTGRRVAAATLTVLSVALVFFLLFCFREVVFALFLAIVLSIAILPAVDLLHRLGLPAWLGVVIVYVVLMLLIVGAAALMLPLLADQVSAVLAKAPAAYDSVRSTLLASGNAAVVSLAIGTPAQLSMPGESSAVGSVSQAVSLIPAIMGGLAGLIFVLALAFYWTLDQEVLVRSFLLRLPLAQRDAVRELIELSQGKVGAYLRGQAILSIVVGAAMTVAMWLIGMPSPLVLGIVAGIFEVVPLLGPFLGAILPLLLAVTGSPDKIVSVIVAVIIIQELEGQLLVPRVMNAAVGVNPILTILAFAAFTSLLGFTGAILTVPLVAIIQILINRFVLPFRIAGQPAEPDGRDRLSVLQLEAHDLIEDVRARARREGDVPGEHEDQVGDMIEHMATDLEARLAGTAQEEAKS